MIMMDRIFGWIFTAFGVGALVGAVGYGAWWHLFTVAVCVVMAWMLFREAKEERAKKKKA